MVRESSVKKFSSILEGLRAQIAPVYFLYGEEVYLQDTFLKTLYERYAEKFKTQWTKYAYHASEIEGETILNQLVGGTLFAEPKIVVVKEVDTLENSAKEALLDYLAQPMAEVTVVLIKESPRLTDKFSKAVKKLAIPVEVRIPAIYEMDEWAQHFLVQHKIQASADARAMLIDLSGDSLQSLINELKKIQIYLPEESRELSAELLHDFVGATRSHSVFEFVDVLGTKSLPDILRYLFSLLEEGESVSYIVRKTADFYIELWTLKAMLSENYDDKAINRVVFNGRNLTWKYKKFHKKYTTAEIARAFPLLEQADYTSKSTSAVEPRNYLTALFYELMADKQELVHE